MSYSTPANRRVRIMTAALLTVGWFASAAEADKRFSRDVPVRLHAAADAAERALGRRVDASGCSSFSAEPTLENMAPTIELLETPYAEVRRFAFELLIDLYKAGRVDKGAVRERIMKEIGALDDAHLKNGNDERIKRLKWHDALLVLPRPQRITELCSRLNSRKPGDFYYALDATHYLEKNESPASLDVLKARLVAGEADKGLPLDVTRAVGRAVSRRLNVQRSKEDGGEALRQQDPR